MSTEPYVETVMGEDEKEHKIINERAYINPSNINDRKFKFDSPGDITDSIMKDTKENTGKGFSDKSGRIAYAGSTCVYPDNTYSSKIPLTGCIADHRPKAKEEYGRTYMSVGIPVSYCEKIINDARTGANIKLQVSPKAQKANGYWWMNVNFDKLGEDKTNFIYEHENEHKRSIVNMREFMDAVDSKVDITMLCGLGASHTTESIDVKPELDKVTYNLSLKPFEIFIYGASKVEGPKFEFESRSRESINIAPQLVASNELAALAMSRLNLGN